MVQTKSGIQSPAPARKKRKFKARQGFILFLLCIPFLVQIFIFNYLPLSSWSYAFFRFKAGYNLFDTPFVGLDNFVSIFGNAIVRSDVARVIRNTLSMSFIIIATSWLPMLFAIFLAELNGKFRKVVQTITTIPNFISWVLVFSLVFSMFSTQGFINTILLKFGIVDSSINFLYASGPKVWLIMWAYYTWKTLGWKAILYIAGLTGIDAELYEAAGVDGATRSQRIRYITIPCLLPTFFVLLLLSISNLLNQGIDQYYILQNPLNKSFIEVLDLYVYNRGIAGPDISFATAVGVLKSIISVTLLFMANFGSKLLRGESIF